MSKFHYSTSAEKTMMMNIFLFNESDPKKASEYCKDLSQVFETMSQAQDYIRSKTIENNLNL
jgi:hypothetical protein